jgi:hypothetical protein
VSTTVTVKPGIDNWLWRGLNSPALFGTTTGSGGFEGCFDQRNDISRDPHFYFSCSAAIGPAQNSGFSRYNPYLDGFDQLQGSGTFPVGAIGAAARSSGFYAHQPSRGPRGTLAAGATVNTVVLSTALPTAVGVNALANRGDGVGYKIRIIGNSAAASGKTEERYIIANTGGTTPTLTLGNSDGTANALSFTPASGDAYEFLSGRVYNINSTAASSRSYDILTGTIAAIATTNAPTLTTDACGLWLDEGLTPATRAPGEGFLIGAATYNGAVFGCLTATATAAGTLTGQAVAGDAAVMANEWRNFQIRIVEDTGTPTAVGQRRKITSHTAGASPVYTLASNWTVTPSSTAKYVIEYANELLVFTGAGTNTTTYVSDAVGGASADTWSTATYAARGNAGGLGMNVSGMWGAARVNDLPSSPTAKLVHPSLLVFFRASSSFTTDLFDISGASTGSWTNGLQADHNRATGLNPFQNFASYSRVVYDPASLSGRYAYALVTQANDTTALTQSTISTVIWRYDLVTRQFLGAVGIPAQFNGSNSKAIWLNFFVDGTTKIARLGVFGSPNTTTNFTPPVPHLAVDLLN